jgi:hypothetical protein
MLSKLKATKRKELFFKNKLIPNEPPALNKSTTRRTERRNQKEGMSIFYYCFLCGFYSTVYTVATNILKK